jgi:hypothetical protein
MKNAHFYLKLSPDELLEYYQGYKKYVRVRTFEGYSIQFRAEHLRQWVKPYGINGEFEIRFDSNNKFAGLFIYRDLSSGAIASSVSTKQPTPPTSDSANASVPSGPNQRPRGFKTSI